MSRVTLPYPSEPTTFCQEPKVALPLDPLSPLHGTGLASSPTGKGTNFRTPDNLNNRGRYFTLDPRHPNVLAPGKRTFHTLMATLVTGARTVLLGSMGGDIQPQVNVQVLTRHLDRGLSLPEAIAAPRFACPATIYGSAPLYREAGLRLPRARLLPRDPSAFGHAQGISILGGEVEVGIDPRGDGLLPLPSRAGTLSRIPALRP